jgi:hypothetical protein
MASIKIVEVGGVAKFRPARLAVNRGEQITWDNQTNGDHWPWPVDTQGNLLSQADAVRCQMFLSNRIPGGQVSTPVYTVDPLFSPQPKRDAEPAQGTVPALPERPATPPPDVPLPKIKYVCRLHPGKRGSIVVLNP